MAEVDLAARAGPGDLSPGHDFLNDELNRLIETRAAFKEFEKTAKAWARIYCRIARACHYAMIIELNCELKKDDAAKQAQSVT